MQRHIIHGATLGEKFSVLHGIGFSFMTIIFLIHYYRCHVIKSKGRKKVKAGNDPSHYMQNRWKENHRREKLHSLMGKKRSKKREPRKVCHGTDFNPASSATFSCVCHQLAIFLHGLSHWHFRPSQESHGPSK